MPSPGTGISFDHDPVGRRLGEVLAALAAGAAPGTLEGPHVDVKEEPGRRARDGGILAGRSENEVAARYLAGELACFANTPGGGAIVLGVADDGTRIGTALNAEWLRHRIWELTEGRLTVAVRAAELAGVRLLVLTTFEAIEPIRFAGRFRWRLADRCVEMDPTSWHAEQRRRAGHDWSAIASGHTLDDVQPVAVEVARRYLRAAGALGDAAAADLAEATTPDLLRRLQLVDGDGRLVNAGALLFVGTPGPGIDYLRRDVPGGDSTARIRSEKALLEQVYEVEAACDTANRRVHVAGGFAHAQLRALPPRAVREALVNGVVHRDWGSAQPTVVEHIGDRLTVTSPGGFVGGIAPSNIITHPATARYRRLAAAVAALRLAEQEGIGIDRMVGDLLALGHPEPSIAQIEGPCVRVALVGGAPDAEILALLGTLEPPERARDLDVLLLLTRLRRLGWLDVATAAPVLQRSPAETGDALARLVATTVAGTRLLVAVHGIPPDTPPAWRASDGVRARFPGMAAVALDQSRRTSLLMGWARGRGRISSSEAADLAGVSVTRAGGVLLRLEQDGALRPGREVRRGRGFFYVPAETPIRSP